MIEVLEKKQIKESCNNCLYGKSGGCSNANMKEDWVWHRIAGFACLNYCLDPERFEITSGYGERRG